MRKTIFLSALILCSIMSAKAFSKDAKVIAHRGYWDTEGSAQNSIRSLVKADSIGCYASEFDVWLTADKKLIVNHDDVINGYVIETTNSDIILSQKLKNGENIPTLSDFLDQAKKLKVHLILELKPHKNAEHEREAVKMVVEMVKGKTLENRTDYITFSRNALDEFIRDTKRPVYYLNGTMTPQELKDAKSAGPDYHINVLKKNADWIEKSHDLGLKVNAWTVNSADGIKWCIDNGVDFITTNAPELTMEIITNK